MEPDGGAGGRGPDVRDSLTAVSALLTIPPFNLHQLAERVSLTLHGERSWVLPRNPREGSGPERDPRVPVAGPRGVEVRSVATVRLHPRDLASLREHASL